MGLLQTDVDRNKIANFFFTEEPRYRVVPHMHGREQDPPQQSEPANFDTSMVVLEGSQAGPDKCSNVDKAVVRQVGAVGCVLGIYLRAARSAGIDCTRVHQRRRLLYLGFLYSVCTRLHYAVWYDMHVLRAPDRVRPLYMHVPAGSPEIGQKCGSLRSMR